MSKYADYESFSKSYDARRPVPSALNLELGAFFTKLKKPLGELHILDAGCGTGIYAKAMLGAGVGKMTLIDASEGMLTKAEEKVKDFVQEGRANILQHCLPTLPFEDEIFDVVLFNYVLPHLDQQNNFEITRHAMTEAKRVLKQGGLLVILTSFLHQIIHGYWYYELAPKARQLHRKLWMKKDEVITLLKQVGFRDIEVIVPVELVDASSEDEFFSGDWILNPNSRDKDQIWAFITNEEMLEVEGKVKAMIDEGIMKDFIEKHDQPRKEIGQMSVVFSLK